MSTAKPSMSQIATRLDGWTNVYTGLSSVRDSDASTYYKANSRVDRNQLEQLYRSDGLARKVVDVIPDDMLRRWISISGDASNEFMALLDRVQFKTILSRLLRYARLYGGALAVAIVDDGSEINEPLNPNGIKDILGFRVYDRWQVSWTTTMLYDNPLTMRYGYPEQYLVTPYEGQSFYVHESRTIRMDGAYLPENLRINNGGWADSVLEAAFRPLMRYGATHAYAANLVRDFEQKVLSVDGLAELIASGNEQQVLDRISILDQGRSVINTLILDSQETFTKSASSVAGLSELLDRFAANVSAVTGIPQAKLFGEAPGGLNATGDADLTNYYDMIASQQVDRLTDPINWTLEIAARVLGTERPPFEFRPLETPNESEIVTMRAAQAQTDSVYIGMGVLTPNEVRESRFGGRGYSIETELADQEPLSEAEIQEYLAGRSTPESAEEGAETGEEAGIQPGELAKAAVAE